MRYAAIAKFKEVGEKGQKTLEQKTVAIVGLGNIGSTVAVMLLRAGINLRLVDKGRVSIGDLASQSMYLEDDHAKFKAKQAKKYLEEINPKVKVKTFHEDLTKNNIYLIDADVVIDATGDLDTTKLISDETRKKKTPVIFAAVSGSEGIITTSDKGIPTEKIKPALAKMKRVDEAGVISPAVHMASAIIVSRVIKVLLKKNYGKDMTYFDAWTDTIKKSKI